AGAERTRPGLHGVEGPGRRAGLRAARRVAHGVVSLRTRSPTVASIGRVLVCLVVPLAGTDAADAVARAVHRHHPDAEVAAVWAGDPQLRPRMAPAGAEWVDVALGEPTGVGWNRLYVALSPSGYGWARAARATERLLAGAGDGGSGDGIVV